MHRFLMQHAERLEALDYASLYRWSVEKPAEFWAAVWDFCGIRAQAPYRTVVEHYGRMPGASWFDGAMLNYAENLLGHGQQGVALVFADERGERVTMSWVELRRQVASVSEALRGLGVGPGDRVAALLPNRPETIVAALAAACLGATWSSCSPDFGVHGVLDRFGQIAPKVLFAVDGYFYNGKSIDCLDALATIAAALEGLEAVVVTAYRHSEPDLSSIPGALRFDEISGSSAELSFEPLPFAHPLSILYSSGTTGIPKCIVHGAGGTLLQHRKEHVLHTDIRAGDVVFYFTSCGWMMWNWLLSTLACGATVVLYDGAPLYPDPGVLWRIAERESITVFGTSARYLSALEKTGYKPREHVKLDALKAVLSTGSPLAPSSFDYVYADIKADVQLASISGGTDIVSCFALGNPLLPVHRGELQSRGLGMKVGIFNEAGEPVTEEKGELVCTAPFPSMPLGFWNDPGQTMYRTAYFDRFANVWWHGDYAELTEHDGITMFGRSDAVLNPGGVRIGTAEIYRVVEQMPELVESIVVGQQWEDDTRIVLFVRLRADCTLDAGLEQRIRQAIRKHTTPRHVPAKILAVDDIPRTRSGKIVELAVRDLVHGREVTNKDALANPEALDGFRNRPELSA
ncbi:acetoacetate--CoA ligase [Candidatus Rariloculus sp.]|uniref:acetoacetate--CoA ligase n=1 Tax=Candidatus Rariloculus sp. TaxID=3101265 RepID=UPI003D09CFA1